MIDKNNPNINDLKISDFEELATHIIQGQCYNKDFYRCEIDIYFKQYKELTDIDKVADFRITTPYLNLIEEYFFTRSFGVLIPYLKVNSLDTISTITPFVDGELEQSEQDQSRKLIHDLVCQAQPLNSDRDNFIVTSTRVLNYENLKSSFKPNSYTYYFDYPN